MSDEVAPTGEATADGRARRSERSRAALVEALLAGTGCEALFA